MERKIVFTHSFSTINGAKYFINLLLQQNIDYCFHANSNTVEMYNTKFIFGNIL